MADVPEMRARQSPETPFRDQSTSFVSLLQSLPNGDDREYRREPELKSLRYMIRCVRFVLAQAFLFCPINESLSFKPALHGPLCAVRAGAGFLFCPEVIARWP